MKRSSLSQREKFLFGLFVVLSLLAFVYIEGNAYVLSKTIERDQSLERAKVATYLTTTLGAKSVLVYDLTDGVSLYAQHEESKRPIASITKIMTALIASKYLPQGEVLVVGKGDEPYFEEAKPMIGSSWTANDLTKFMLVGSSNNAALILATHTFGTVDPFIEKMNEKARKLGLDKTYFNTVTGLDSGTEPQAISTAKEVALLAGFAYKSLPGVFNETTKPEVVFRELGGQLQSVANTNSVVTEIQNIKLSKTGFTDSAGGNIVVIYTSPSNGHDIAIVVLGSSREGRTKDLLTLYDATEKFIKLSLANIK